MTEINIITSLTAAGNVRTAAEDVDGTVKWRTYIDGVLDSDEVATPEQQEKFARLIEGEAVNARVEKGRNLLPWLRNVADNWDGLTNAQKFARMGTLFDELFDALKELGVGD